MEGAAEWHAGEGHSTPMPSDAHLPQQELPHQSDVANHKWLLNCKTSLEEEEINLWLLVSPLTNGSDAATKDLAKRLMAAWKWAGVVSESPLCQPTPTVLNIRQFFNKDLTGHGWSQQEWLLVYARVLQRMGRLWRGEI